MRTISAQELTDWLAMGKVLEADGRGPKVVALENGLFLKIFHTRKHPLLARLQPAAQRFARNAALLQRLGISVPHVVETFWITRSIGLSGCLYEPLPGKSLDALFRQAPDEIEHLLPPLAGFIRSLHGQKIYFRSLHLGNIMVLPDHRFGLIDFLDLKRTALPLNAWQIKRNFRHMERHLNRARLPEFPFERLAALYHSQKH